MNSREAEEEAPTSSSEPCACRLRFCWHPAAHIARCPSNAEPGSDFCKRCDAEFDEDLRTPRF